MKKDRLRVLVALDGSEQSSDTVKYAAGLLAPESEVVLLHVMSKVPEPLRDLGLNPAWHMEDKGLREWEAQEERRIEEFMAKGRRAFLDAGFRSDAVKVEVRELKEGFARDITAEALRGYDAIALGRKGLNPLHEAVLGSIAAKIVIKLCRIPIWLIGGRPQAGKVLIAMDPSDCAMLAVDHVGKVMDGATREVKLLHVVRGLRSSLAGYQKVLVGEYLEKLTQEAEDKIRPVFEEATDHLAALGIPPEKVCTQIISGVSSRAGAILKEADAGDYGTIVTGRRGLTRVENYDMGRVSYKLIQMAKDRAVWVVGC